MGSKNRINLGYIMELVLHFHRNFYYTIAFYPYNKCEDTMNFIVHIDNKFVLYALKREKQHTSCNTIYTLNTKALKKLYKQENFTLLKQNYIEIIEGAITD